MDTNKMTFVCRTSRPEEIAHMLNWVGWYGDFYSEGESVFWDAGCKPDNEDLAEVKGFATGAHTAIAEQAAQIAELKRILRQVMGDIDDAQEWRKPVMRASTEAAAREAMKG